MIGVIQAGGLGTRMRASGVALPKPLVPVAGVPLMERALYALLGAGLREIHVVTSPAVPAVLDFARSRLAPVCAAVEAELHLFVEESPLGTIGAVAQLGTPGGALVINGDNLCDLDLAAFVEDHRTSGAALTVSTHLEPFRIPFAEVVVEGRQIVAYREKPELPVRVSSAVYALGPAALEAMVPGEPLGAPTLVQRLLQAGAAVHSHAHEAHWVDVNDATALERAEAMLHTFPQGFECWSTGPLEVVGCLLEREDRLLLERRPDTSRAYPGVWDTPGGRIEPGETPVQAVRREIREELGVTLDEVQPIGCFDDVDIVRGGVVRHHVFRARPTAEPRPAEGQVIAWRNPVDTAPLSPVVTRSLARARRVR